MQKKMELTPEEWDAKVKAIIQVIKEDYHWNEQVKRQVKAKRYKTLKAAYKAHAEYFMTDNWFLVTDKKPVKVTKKKK